MTDSIIEHVKQDALFCHNKFIRDYLDIALFIGIEKQAFLDAIGLSITDIEDPQALIPRSCLFKGYDILLTHSQDELLGVGQKKLSMGGVDLMVKVATVDKTLEQAIRSIDQLVQFSQSKLNSTIDLEDDIVRWRFSPDVVKSSFYPFITTLCLIVGLRMLSLLIKLDIPLIKASFTFDKQENDSDYRFLFACPIEYNQPYNELCFDRSWLKKSIQVDYYQVKPLLKSPLTLASYIKGSLGLSRQIKDILASYPNANFPKPSAIAEQLGMSLRKMQRKLELEDTSYMQLKDFVRQQKAEYYLTHTSKNMGVIAERCGFSESASFNRTFKRWTGISPSQFREGLNH